MESQFPQGYSAQQGSQHGYIPTRTHQGYRQSRSSSFPSQSPQQAFQLQDYHHPNGSLEDAGQYSFGQTAGWEAENIVLPDLSSTVQSDINLVSIHDITSSERDPPWDPTVGSQGRGPGNRLQYPFSPPLSSATKAATVAGPADLSDRQFKRPALVPRTSFASAAESGYFSQSQYGSLTSPSQFERKADVFIPVSAAPEAPKPPASVKTDPNPRGSAKNKRKRSKSFNANCEICDKELKNPSDAAKHSHQHSKPHGCDICNKKDKTFATFNDLERHRKAVHHVRPRVGKTTAYFCQACTPHPGSAPKEWPRLDNFKAHIKRKHSSVNMDELIKRSEFEVERPLESEYGLSSQPPLSISQEDNSYQQEWPSADANAMSRYPSQHTELNTMLGFDSQVAHVGGMGDYQVNNMSVPGIQLHGPQYPTDGMMMLHHAAAYQQMTSTVDSMNLSPTTHLRLPAPDVYVNDQPYTGNDETDIDSRSAKRVKMVAPSPSVSQETVSSANAEGDQHRCMECGKVKRRDCDLRKHMKRHTRPYGCTFAKCYKRFGSRNDWKRHENSQHFLSEMWRCSMPRSNGQNCGLLSHDQQQFAIHLFHAHSISPRTEKSAMVCRDMHIGREGHHHFWCGFCNELIEQEQGIQPGAWNVRFKHIGDHFDKDNLNIDDWIDIEQNRKKKLIDSEENRTKASVNSTFDDDSDLGESGIPSVPVMQVVNRRKTMNEDVDADGVSDDDWC